MSIGRFVRKSLSKRVQNEHQQNKSFLHDRRTIESAASPEDERKLQQSKKKTVFLPLSVQAVIFLQTRPMTKEHGKLLYAINTKIYLTDEIRCRPYYINYNLFK